MGSWALFRGAIVAGSMSGVRRCLLRCFDEWGALGDIGRTSLRAARSAVADGKQSGTWVAGLYFVAREPVIRISTSLLALCCQSGPVATLETPMSARSRSNGSRSLHMSPLLMAVFTITSIATAN